MKILQSEQNVLVKAAEQNARRLRPHGGGVPGMISSVAARSALPVLLLFFRTAPRRSSSDGLTLTNEVPRRSGPARLRETLQPDNLAVMVRLELSGETVQASAACPDYACHRNRPAPARLMSWPWGLGPGKHSLEVSDNLDKNGCLDSAIAAAFLLVCVMRHARHLILLMSLNGLSPITEQSIPNTKAKQTQLHARALITSQSGFS